MRTSCPRGPAGLCRPPRKSSTQTQRARMTGHGITPRGRGCVHDTQKGGVHIALTIRGTGHPQHHGPYRSLQVKVSAWTSRVRYAEASKPTRLRRCRRKTLSGKSRLRNP